jgi:hypothetical protein
MRRFVEPGQLKAELEEVAASLPAGAFIRDPKCQHLKEIWCAAHFGRGYARNVALCTVWVNAEQNTDTDFVLKVGNSEFPFQTTLSDVPGRRMGDDHKPDPTDSLRTRPYEPGRGSAEGPTWIAAAVRRKVEANYSTASKLNLLVYGNFDTNGLDYAAIRRNVEPVAGGFESIWLITNHQICSIVSTSELGEVAELRPICDLIDL